MSKAWFGHRRSRRVVVVGHLRHCYLRVTISSTVRTLWQDKAHCGTPGLGSWSPQCKETQCTLWDSKSWHWESRTRGLAQRSPGVQDWGTRLRESWSPFYDIVYIRLKTSPWMEMVFSRHQAIAASFKRSPLGHHRH